MQTLHFVRGNNEYRQVSVNENGDYRIWAQTGGIGKLHHGFSEYYQHLMQNGWRKVPWSEMLRIKWKGERA